MDVSNLLIRHEYRLLQIGVALFLFTSFEGFVIPYMPVPRLGLSVHTLSAIEGLVFMALGLAWPKLALGRAAAGAAFWLFVYSAFATLVPYVMAAAWGAGTSTIPLAAGTAHGTAFQEAVIKGVLYTAAPTGIISFVLVLYGLRIAPAATSRP